MSQKTFSTDSSSKIAVSGLSAKKLLSSVPTEGFGLTASVSSETVIGQDDRVRILDTSESPWRMICGLHIRAGGLSYRGTGWLVSPKTVVTAGHCVYDSHTMGGWATSIEVTPGLDREQEPFGKTESRNFSSVAGWIEDRDPDQDFAAIHLDEAFGDSIGWFPISVPNDEELVNGSVHISGYPADRGYGREQHHHKNRVRHMTKERLFYEVDTYGGQSGSPVFVIDPQSGVPRAIGIHAYGIGGTPNGFGITANSGPRITSEVADLIRSWS